MALTYGFYNSIEGDRKYDATQVSRIFDGIIKDGVYATYEKALIVIASENAGEVIIQPGRAWFNHTWSYNDANLIMQAPAPEVLLDRIDALVLEVNEELAVRVNSFKWVQGTPSSRPENPTLTNTSTVHQYPLCYIHRYPETTMIYTRDITNMIGTSECPFVTGVLEGIDLDAWINQWDNEFHNWENTTKTSFETWMLNQESTYIAWETAMKAQMADDIEDVEEWVETIRNIIDAETATHLQNEIDELRSEITSGSHIIINTSETELFGREVTITTEEGVILTEEFDSNGVADFKSVPYVGNLTVSSSYGTETAERIISTPYYARYTFTLAFWSATVNIVGEPEWVGQTVTVKDSELVIVDTVTLDSAGEGVFTATRPDTYLFTLTYGGETMEVTLSVTQETTYTVELHAQGSVNLAYWLTAGSTTEHPINPSSYSTFADVEADEEVVRQLMTVHNAVDYLATSDGADELIGQIINSDICAKWINLRDYALDTLSANVAVKALMDTADKYGYGEWALMPQVPKMTSNTAPYGVASASSANSGYDAYKAFDGVMGTSEGNRWSAVASDTNKWLQYQFVSPIKISQIAIYPRHSVTYNITVKGSNDGTTFDDLTTFEITGDGADDYNKKFTIDIPENKQATYSYYRLSFDIPAGTSAIVGELQFYAWQPKGNVPVMTSNTAPYGEASASASASGKEAYRAFGGTFTSDVYWQANSSSAWIKYKFINPICVKAYRAAQTVNASRTLNITLQGSNDNSTWENIEGSSASLAPSNYNVVTKVTNNKYYLYYRVNCSSSDNYCVLTLLQFYGRELSVSVPTMTSDTAPWGEASASSVYSTYLAWKAFDKATNTLWCSGNQTSATNIWLQYRFKNATLAKIAKVSFYSYISACTYKIQGSNNGSDWHDVSDVQDNISGAIINLTSDTAYSYYRLLIISQTVTSTYYCGRVFELNFYGLDYSEREFAEGSTMKYIYDHGVELEETITRIGSGAGNSVTEANNHVYAKGGTVASSVTNYAVAFWAVNFGSSLFSRIRAFAYGSGAHGGMQVISSMNKYPANGSYSNDYVISTLAINDGADPKNRSINCESITGTNYVGIASMYDANNYNYIDELWLE